MNVPAPASKEIGAGTFYWSSILNSDAPRFHDRSDFIGVYADHRFAET